MALQDKKKFAPREIAHRIFAEELRKTKFSAKFSTDEKAPEFIITPTGAKASRLLITGILTNREKKQLKNGNNMYNLKVHDLTGDFYCSVGNFQPEAMVQISGIQKTPEFVTIIGKPNLYTNPDTGKIYTNVRVEDIVITDKETRNIWVLDTAKATMNRIQHMESDTDPWSIEVKEKYGRIEPFNPTDWKKVVDVTLSSLVI